MKKNICFRRRLGLLNAFIVLICLWGLYSYYSIGVIHSIVINEVCASNSSIDTGAEKFCDYVELYNKGLGSCPYRALYLSDDVCNLKKLQIDSDGFGAGEYWLVNLDATEGVAISRNGEELYLSNEYGEILDQVRVPQMKQDTSYIRRKDGGTLFGMGEGTPGYSNMEGKQWPLKPEFSLESGFYRDAFTVKITAKDGEIYYTLDGSEPDEDSLRYKGAILVSDASKNENVYSMLSDVSVTFDEQAMADFTDNDSPDIKNAIYQLPDSKIDKCTIVRAVCIDQNGNRSDITTKCFFVGYSDKTEKYAGLNILSLTTAPENLFDYENGIYVAGRTFAEYKDVLKNVQETGEDQDGWSKWWVSWNANYSQRGRDWERPVSAQLFNSAGELLLNQECGIRMQGGANRARLPRSMKLVARSEYDAESRFDEDLFQSGYPAKTINLFAGGNDVVVKLNDYLAMSLLKERSHGYATMHFIPVAMFLDGEYWGNYYLTEMYDDVFLNYYYGVDLDNSILLEKDAIRIGEESEYQLYEDTIQFLSTTDFSDEQNYQIACDLVDIDSYIQYYAVEMYLARHNDWIGDNYGIWRSREIRDESYQDGKWRFLLFDLNGGAMERSQALEDSFTDVRNWDLTFRRLTHNESFREKLRQEMLTLAEKDFEPERVKQFIEDYRQDMSAPMANEYDRFYGSNNDRMGVFEDTLADLEQFFYLRASYITEYFKDDSYWEAQVP